MGNNPVCYKDPDGRIQRNSREYDFVREVIGETGVKIFDATKYICIPKFGRSASWDIFGGIIFLSSDIYSNPMASNEGRNVFIHELFHQVQYAQSSESFGRLISELELNESVAKFGLNPLVEYSDRCSVIGGSVHITPDYATVQDNYTYNYGDLSSISKISDLQFLESQAQLVGDFAELYYSMRYDGVRNNSDVRTIKQMARILNNSGYDTEAVRWIQNEL